MDVNMETFVCEGSASLSRAGRRFSQTASQSVSSSSSSTCHWSCTVSTSGSSSFKQQNLSENKAKCVVPGAATNSGLIGEGRSVPLPLNADKDIQRAFVNLLSLFTPQNGNDDDLQPRTNKRHSDPSDALWSSSWKDLQGAEQEVVVSVTLEELYFGTVKQVSIKKALVDERSKSSKFVKDDILLSLKPGTQDGSRLRFPGRGSTFINVTGSRKCQDLVVVVQQSCHPRFERIGDDLIANVQLDLRTALGGGSFSLKTLDDRDLKVPITQVVKPNSHTLIRGEGMPSKSNPKSKGDLLIQFDVRLPTCMTAAEKARIAALFSQSQVSARGSRASSARK
eukprot:jgi/Botrbrau1/15861/Bobra.40_1s0045.1